MSDRPALAIDRPPRKAGDAPVKYRHPDSFEYALMAIAGLLGWERVAKIARQSVRTVQDWSDPDSPRTPPIGIAVELDRAWAAAGGVGCPFHHAWECVRAHPPVWTAFDPARLGDATVICIQEGGQAKSALVRAILPGSTPCQRREAAHEVAECIRAFMAALPMLGVRFPARPPP